MNRRLANLFAIPLLALGILATALGSSAAEPRSAAPRPPEIWPVRSHPYNRSYEAWAAAWWQWAFSLPNARTPLLDTTGGECMVGQQGRVWNLAGVPGAGAVTRHCQVPSDRALFFPIFNAFNINVAPPPYASDEELVQILVDFVDQVVTSVAVDLDGRPLAVTLGNSRIRPHLFSYALPADNILLPFFGLSIPAGAYGPAADDGYYVMLSPLPPGPHILHFTASGSFSGDPPELLQDVTYELEVVPLPSIPVPQ